MSNNHKRQRRSTEQLPRLYPSTSTSSRPVRASRYTIPKRLWGTVYVCHEYPDGVFINKHGVPEPHKNMSLPKIKPVKLVTDPNALKLLSPEERAEQADLAYDQLLKLDRKRKRKREEEKDEVVESEEEESSDDMYEEDDDDDYDDDDDDDDEYVDEDELQQIIAEEEELEEEETKRMLEEAKTVDEETETEEEEDDEDEDEDDSDVEVITGLESENDDDDHDVGALPDDNIVDDVIDSL